jgi:hypothetical protein
VDGRQSLRLRRLPELARQSPRRHNTPTVDLSKLVNMPIEILDAEVRTATLASMKSDLLFLFEERDIPENVVALIGKSGIKTVSIFAKVESKEEEFRGWLEELSIKKSEGNRALQASLVDAWDAARLRVTEDNEAAAKARSEGRPKEMLKGSQLELRKAYQRIVGELPDRKYPSYAYINARVSEIEDGELEAETLDYVTNHELEKARGAADFNLEWTRGGQARLRQQKLRGSLPSNTEELRSVMTVMRHHWGVVRMRHGSKPYLAELDGELWTSYTEFLLGEEAYGYSVKNDEGRTVASLSWHALLRYDQEMRSWAMHKVNMGTSTLRQAMVDAQSNDELKTKFVLGPLALSHLPAAIGKRTHADTEPNLFQRGDGNKSAKRAKGKGKGKSKPGKAGSSSDGKGGGGNQESRFALARRHKQTKQNADGKPVCWAYNKAIGCKNPSCSFLHVCLHCGGAHSLEDCRKFGEWLSSR